MSGGGSTLPQGVGKNLKNSHFHLGVDLTRKELITQELIMPLFWGENNPPITDVFLFKKDAFEKTCSKKKHKKYL